MDLAIAIKQYAGLKRSKDLLEKRLEKLREVIIAQGPGVYTTDTVACIVREHYRTEVDEGALLFILDARGCSDCYREVPDRELVKQAILEGRLDDDALEHAWVEYPVLTVHLEEVDNGL